MEKAKFDIYEVITSKIIESLEAGNIPWLKPWKNGGHKSTMANLPYNGATGRNYNGMNLLLLGCTDYAVNAWYSFKQVKDLGGNVKAGEKSTMVIYWQFNEKVEDNGEVKRIPFCRYYNVFNYAQCENLPFPKQQPFVPVEYTDIDALVINDLGIALNHGGDRAYYAPASDRIQMPALSQFTDTEHYKAKLLHELTHSTGYASRCNRDFKGRFGDAAYAFEELVAELGSAFLSSHFQVEPMLQHNAGYIQSWLKVLKDDKRAIITASSQATKACQWVLDKLASPEQVEEPLPLAA